MNQPSHFQLEHPLSATKKFWKKMFLAFLRCLIYAAAVSFSLGFYIAQLNAPVNSFGNAVLDAQTIILSFVLVFLVTYVVILSLYAWYVLIYIRRYYYDCNDQFVTIKKGVFAPAEIHVQYQKIQDVYVDQDIIDRAMGLYDVHIASATVTSGIEAHIDGVTAETAEKIKNFLLGKIKNGGNGGSSMASNNSQPELSPSGSPAFQSDKKVSTEAYPISNMWLLVAIKYAFVWSLSLTILLWVFGFYYLARFGANYSHLLIFFAVAFVFQIVWSLIWKSNYYFELKPDYILLKTGVISRQEIHLPYRSIQNITNKQDIIERIFGLATVIVQNAVASGVNVTIVGQPKGKAEELNQILNKITSSQSQASTRATGV